MCGINAAGAQRCGCMFTFCHAYLKMGVLLHKMAIVCNQKFMAVRNTYFLASKAKYSMAALKTNFAVREREQTFFPFYS